MTREPSPSLRWQDFPRPDDKGYYEVRFDYLSQGDILDDAPLLLVPDQLELDVSEGGNAVAAIPVQATAAIIVTPTCDFRRPSASELKADPSLKPYALRQQLVVARVMPLEDWELTQPVEGRSTKLEQMKGYDNLRQYMYLPLLDERLGESLVDLGTTWTLPLPIALTSRRLTQLASAGAQQLQYKLAMYQTARPIDRDGLQPPMD